MNKHYWFAGLFNFVFGCLLFFVLSLWFMSFLYIAEMMGWIMDPTLDEGLLIIFLILSLGVSVIYFPTLILTNIKLCKKVSLSKLYYGVFATGILTVGLLSFFGIIKLF